MATESIHGTGQKIVPFLWFDTQAEAAMQFYTSLFEDSKIGTVSRYGEGGPGPAGSVMVGTFTLAGQEFMVLNGGPEYKFSPAISLFVNCDTQDEVDKLWDKLSDGGKPNQCGWIDDKFGVTWQVVPTLLGKLMADPDPEKSGRVMQAMLKMVKLDSVVLQKAYDGTL